MYKIEKIVGRPSYRRRENSLKSLVKIIVGQQLSGKAADTINKRLRVLLNDDYSPSVLLDTQVNKMRECGISYAKIGFVKDISNVLLNSPNYLIKLEGLNPKTAIDELKSLKGVGDWTATIFTMFNLGHLDVFAKADVSLIKAISKIYKVNLIKDDHRLDMLKSMWSPYTTLACIFLWSWVDANMPDLE
jgi:DNA-3-methyladenine glycosylase II